MFKSESDVKRVAAAVIGNPSEHFKDLKALVKFAIKFGDSNLGLMSILCLTQVFRDISPSYPVVRDTDDSKSSKRLSKSIMERRLLEDSILRHYKNFVFFLISNVQKPKSKSQKNKSSGNISKTSIYSLCSLIDSLYSFNFSEKIAKSLISRMSAEKNRPYLAKLISDTLSNLAKRGEKVSLIVTKTILSKLNKKSFKNSKQSFNQIKVICAFKSRKTVFDEESHFSKNYKNDCRLVQQNVLKFLIALIQHNFFNKEESLVVITHLKQNFNQFDSKTKYAICDAVLETAKNPKTEFEIFIHLIGGLIVFLPKTENSFSIDFTSIIEAISKKILIFESAKFKKICAVTGAFMESLDRLNLTIAEKVFLDNTENYFQKLDQNDKDLFTSLLLETQKEMPIASKIRSRLNK